jgi:hypothetical protein
MLQTCDVGFCVEEGGGKAPDVGCCTQHGSQHGRNIVATWSQHGGRREERLLMLDVARNRVRNMLATRSQHTLVECWKHHGSQHGKSVRNMEKEIATSTQSNGRYASLIVWPGRCPMLAPGSDIRALAAPLLETGGQNQYQGPKC